MSYRYSNSERLRQQILTSLDWRTILILEARRALRQVREELSGGRT